MNVEFLQAKRWDDRVLRRQYWYSWALARGVIHGGAGK